MNYISDILEWLTCFWCSFSTVNKSVGLKIYNNGLVAKASLMIRIHMIPDVTRVLHGNGLEFYFNRFRPQTSLSMKDLKAKAETSHRPRVILRGDIKYPTIFMQIIELYANNTQIYLAWFLQISFSVSLSTVLFFTLPI